jgi:hypothetical protein
MKPKLPVPEDLTPREKWRLIEFCRREYPKWATPERLKWLVGETLDYHRAAGNPRGYTDWVAVCRNRIRWLDARGMSPWRPPEMPQERRSGEKRYPRALAEVIDLAGYKEGSG